MNEEVRDFLVDLKDRYYNNLDRKKQQELVELCKNIENTSEEVRS